MVSNKEKILNALFGETEINVSNLAAKSKIDIKNIGRTLKQLEAEKKIKIRIDQQGKVRSKFISLETKKPIEPIITPKPTTRKEVTTTRKKVITTRKEIIATRSGKDVILRTSENFNPSVELNQMKAIFGNRFGSSTNFLKDEMTLAMITVWRDE